jgi:toxin YoeB
MQIEFTPEAKDDFDYWVKTGNKAILNKIGQLIKSIEENPFVGAGKPEPLKHNLSGKWSRRINLEHRLVYKFERNTLFLYSLKGHYD